MFEVFSNFIEWYGTIAILACYGLTLFHVIPFQGKIFYIGNLSGALALVIGSAFKRNLWSNVMFYFIWAILTALVLFNPFHLHF